MPFVGTQEGILCALVASTIFLEEILTKDAMNVLMIVIVIKGKFIQFDKFFRYWLTIKILHHCLIYVKILTYSHFSNEKQNYKCIDNLCEIQFPVSSSKQEVERPPEYIKAGPRSSDYYYVSEDSLPWPQAQYECQSRSGRLAELGKLNSKCQDYFICGLKKK